ncbi:inositol phospholipid synthesis and fat-storage-inducing TM-domain-containing protein [Xylariaceae sp. FL1272]|nr:inositol phospholipid synthesis and fat-storage-inducing TM-domain-containing protein [Xylariaceae sp. FL1272]
MTEENTSSLKSRRASPPDMAIPTGSPSPPSFNTSTARKPRRGSPFLPSLLEIIHLTLYPIILVFGTLFSVLSPETRAAPFDAIRHAHLPSDAPSYFARKDNFFNVLFVKRGWAWITIAFLAFLATHSTFRVGATRARAVKAVTRWALVTTWWIFVTQWFFGPPLIDRGFRYTGGRCEDAVDAIFGGIATEKEVFTAAACRAAGKTWSGGHDISGHVFLLVLGSAFLVQEVIWVAARAGAQWLGYRDDRAVVMGDGAVKSAGVEAEHATEDHERNLTVGGKFALGVVGLSMWMLLMTAIYFHTWFEKFTGLVVATMGIYGVYFLPRWLPALRSFVGLPGI